MRTSLRSLGGLLVLGVAAASPAAQDLQRSDYRQSYHRVPMRDGVHLHTEVLTPIGAARERLDELPIVFLRTPYGASVQEGTFTRYFDSTFRELSKDGYVFAVQDARGRHRSDGEFEWNRPVRHHLDPDAIDASTDAYDTIQWLVDNVAGNNGKVGMLGVSYPGWYTTMALVDSHPALACASPQASPSDYFVNDDFFHNGAFRLSPSAELPFLLEGDPKANTRVPYDQVDTYEFFLDLGALTNLDVRYLHGASPTWLNFLAHDTYDEFWETGATLPHLKSVPVPVLNVFGWWDAENLGGAHDIYTHLEKLDANQQSRIVVGPWSHGQWASANATALGDYEFGSDTSTYYQREVEAPWFAHHLKGASDPGLPEALMFQTGSNVWKRYAAWPPVEGVAQRELFLHGDGSLDWNPPAALRDDWVGFVADPDKPVPYTKRPAMGFWQGLLNAPGKPERFERAGKIWKVEDQRFVADRPDVLVFETEPLEQDLEVTGRIVAKLFTSTTGTDADWVVKLIDVYPEQYPDRPWMGGFQLMVADDVVRAKFRDSLKQPKPLKPGEVTGIDIDLRTRNHLFRKGHRVMVQIQSSWFPLIGRNPQRFGSIPEMQPDDFQRAEHRVHVSVDHPSRLLLDVATPR